MQSDHVVERCDEYQCRDGRCLESCESVYDCTGAYLCNQATGRCELDEPGAIVTINCAVASPGKPSAPPVAWLVIALLGLVRRIRRPALAST
jgi:MYXO-CTERM domain-containing protein